GQIINHDLFDPIPARKGGFDVVVADPPWYLEYYRAFCLRAAQLVKVQGLFVLSLLPSLTRPTAGKDRKRVLSFVKRIGFDVVEIEPAQLSYQLPPFEHAVLEAQGIHCNETWRSADLYVFRKQRTSNEAILLSRPRDDHRWESYAI